MNLKIMTFNVMHCENIETKKIEYDKIIDLIKDNNIDIIGLNEVFGKGFDKNINTDQAHYIAKKLGYFCYFGRAKYINFHQYGNAIISRYPLINPETYIIPTPFIKRGNKLYEKRCLIKTRIDVEGGLTVCIGHLGLNEDEQIKALEKIYHLYEPHRFIIMGDFNIEPNNIILEPLRELVNNASKENLPTYSSIKPYKKLDYIWTSKDINIMETIVPNKVISDHLPVISTIELLKHY